MPEQRFKKLEIWDKLLKTIRTCGTQEQLTSADRLIRLSVGKIDLDMLEHTLGKYNEKLKEIGELR